MRITRSRVQLGGLLEGAKPREGEGGSSPIMTVVRRADAVGSTGNNFHQLNPLKLHQQAGRFVSQGPDYTHCDCPHHVQLSLLLLSCTAPYLKDSIVTSKWCNFLSIGSIFHSILKKSLIVGLVFNTRCFESWIVDVLFFSFFLGAGHTVND